MSFGAELFEAGWRNNQNYILGFVDSTDLYKADFDRVEFGNVIAPDWNILNQQDVLTPPDKAITLVAVVGAPGLDSLTPTFVGLTYNDQDGAPSIPPPVVFEAKAAEGREEFYFFPAGDTGGVAVTGVGATPPPAAGSITFFGGKQLFEDFEEGWPPPPFPL